MLYIVKLENLSKNLVIRTRDLSVVTKKCGMENFWRQLGINDTSSFRHNDDIYDHKFTNNSE
jgi:hypothetical protein